VSVIIIMASRKKRVDFYISGFDCATCIKIVGKALEGLDGIKEINVNYVVNRGYVDFDPDKLNEKQIEERLKDRTNLRIVKRRR